MEQYVIKPWDTRDDGQPAPVDWDMQVPPEVDAIAELVMKEYEMSVSSKTLITSKPDKGGAIWRIETDKGPRSLKVLHRTPERSLYSVGLQEYVVRQGPEFPRSFRPETESSSWKRAESCGLSRTGLPLRKRPK